MLTKSPELDSTDTSNNLNCNPQSGVVMFEKALNPVYMGKSYKFPLLAACASVLPLMFMWPKFCSLFWFEDDWALLDTLRSQGFFHWVLQPFDGIVAPVFKVVWYAAVRGWGGAYIGMISSLWICHAANTWLLTVLLLRIGLSPAGALIAALTFGISWSNIETLGWAAQLFQLTSLTMFLLAFKFMLDFAENNRHLILSCCFACASALCFARGILSGGLVLFWFVLAGGRNFGRRWLWGLAAVLLAPEVVITAVHYLRDAQYSGNPANNMFLIAQFASSYLFLNPLYILFSYPGKAVGLSALIIFGSIKISLIIFALSRSDRKTRNFLWTLLAFDLGNATLLGFGRYWTGLAASVSSRYQYVSLLCFAPFLVIAAGYLIRKFLVGKFRTVCKSLLVACWITILIVPWPRKVNQWIQWRGYGPRAQAAGTMPAQGVALCGLPTSRIQELVREFHLR